MTFRRSESLRWHDYVLECGDSLARFWSEHFSGSGHQPLFVLAKSFDPRTCVALEQLLQSAALERCDACVLVLDSDDEGSANDLSQRAADNLCRILELVNPIGKIETIDLKTEVKVGHQSTAQSATTVFHALSQLEAHSDIIVDVSGMPRSVFFPIVSQLLFLLDEGVSRGSTVPNLFVVVSESPELDAAIDHEGIDEFADYLPRFRGGFDREAAADLPKIWIPILGEHRQTQLERIEDLIKPTEIWPVLPSPARNPRRGDNLVIEYQDYLFGKHRIHPRDFIYASEDNPFDVYRQLCRAVRDCRKTLVPLGGCNIALSALSSKLMSLGVLLSAYDLKTTGTGIGVAHVGCNSYCMRECRPDSKVFGLWLTGRCYESD